LKNVNRKETTTRRKGRGERKNFQINTLRKADRSGKKGRTDEYKTTQTGLGVGFKRPMPQNNIRPKPKEQRGSGIIGWGKSIKKSGCTGKKNFEVLEKVGSVFPHWVSVGKKKKVVGDRKVFWWVQEGVMGGSTQNHWELTRAKALKRNGATGAFELFVWLKGLMGGGEKRSTSEGG